jgi:hypothetical protein
MKIGRFNFGGIFGGLVCAAAAAAIIYLLANQHFPMKAIKVVALAGFGGAAVGNWIWSLATPAVPDELDWQKYLNNDENRASP